MVQAVWLSQTRICLPVSDSAKIAWGGGGGGGWGFGGLGVWGFGGLGLGVGGWGGGLGFGVGGWGLGGGVGVGVGVGGWGVGVYIEHANLTEARISGFTSKIELRENIHEN